VWLHNGATFGKGGEGFVRMNIACPTSVLEEAIERIKSVL
jgi:cystathionine beta-lyase